MVILGLLAVFAGLALNLSLTSKLDRIDGAFDGLDARPAAAPGDTILMVGTRPGGHADVPWLAGDQSVESLMLVEIDPSGTRVGVESIPAIPAAEALVTPSSPSTAVAVVEQWSGRRVDHLMAVDWRIFAELPMDAGVDASYRYGSAPSVQHDYLRGVLEGTLHTAMRKHAWDVYRVLNVTASGVAIDDEWSLLELDRLVIRLRNLRSQHIVFSMARPG